MNVLLILIFNIMEKKLKNYYRVSEIEKINCFTTNHMYNISTESHLNLLLTLKKFIL